MRNTAVKLLLFFVFNLILTPASFAQTWNGTLLCKETGKPIEYANIGIVGKNVGTTSDVSGAFTLDLDKVHDNETIRISSIGFVAIQMKVLDFKNTYKIGSTIYMGEQHN